MTIEKLPKITAIKGGTGTIESEKFALDNYGLISFLFNNEDDNSVTIKVKGNIEDGTAEYLPFKFQTAESEYEEVEPSGKTLTGGGAVSAVVTADSIANKEFDRVSIELTSDGEIATVFALQSQPRYSE